MIIEHGKHRMPAGKVVHFLLYRAQGTLKVKVFLPGEASVTRPVQTATEALKVLVQLISHESKKHGLLTL